MRKNFLEAIMEVDPSLAAQHVNSNYLTLQNVVNQYNAKITGETPQPTAVQAIPHQPMMRPPMMVIQHFNSNQGMNQSYGMPGYMPP